MREGKEILFIVYIRQKHYSQILCDVPHIAVGTVPIRER